VLIFPFAWLLITSLETSKEALRFPPLLTPHVLRFGNYSEARHSAPVGRFFLNSSVVAVSTGLAGS
jgi:multiple sugar transport system permease protein